MSSFAIFGLVGPFASKSLQLENVRQKDGWSLPDSGGFSAEGGDANDAIGTGRHAHESDGREENLSNGYLEPAGGRRMKKRKKEGGGGRKKEEGKEGEDV